MDEAATLDQLMPMALTHTAEQVQFYCFDFSGLGSLEHLPHVGSVTSLHDADGRWRATDPGDNPAASAAIRDDPFGDVFLVIDGLSQVRYIAERESQWQIDDLGIRGPAYGVHIVAALNDWSNISPRLCDTFGTRIELRLPDPQYSEFDADAARQVP